MKKADYVGAVSYETYCARVKNGMSHELAANTPKRCVLDLAKVLEVEAHGLSLSKSAYLLKVSVGALARFNKKHKVEWRGKKVCFWRGEVDPNSNLQQAKKAGIPYSTIRFRMETKNISFSEAMAMWAAK